MAIKYTSSHWGTYQFDPDVRPVDLQPFKSDPHPSMISEGWQTALTDEDVRIKRPALRKGWLAGDKGKARNDDSFVEVPWDEALNVAAAALKDTIETHGNKAIFGGSYGWASAGRFHHAQSQLRRFLNLAGGYTGARNTYSHAAAEVLLPHVIGMTNKEFEEALTTWPLVAAHCTLMLAFGGISTRTAQIAAGGTTEHNVGYWMAQAAANGMQTVCISPLASDVDAIPGLTWQSIRPGTDTALLMALTHELIVQGWHDRAFIDRCVTGWAPYEAYLLGTNDGIAKSADWAARQCDIPADDIRALAARLPNEKVMVTLAWGLQRADHGEQPLWAGVGLAAALGQMGQPGIGFGFGYGSTNMGGRPQRFVSWPALSQGQSRVLDDIPVARISDMLLHPGAAYTYDLETRRYPEIDLVYWAGGNPFHHHQDLRRLERAWTKPRTVIVHDHSWTATARRADIVLPCTTALERDDLMLNRRDNRLVYMSQVAPPMGEARDDFAIFSDLATRLGFGVAFTEGRNTEEWLRHLWAECHTVAASEGLTLPDFETFRDAGMIQPQGVLENRIAFEAFVADPINAPLNTPSGKIEMTSCKIKAAAIPDCASHPEFFTPAESTFDAVFPYFHLISNQPPARLHGQLDNGVASKALKTKDRETCTLQTAMARSMRIKSGDIVLIHNMRGGCLAGVLLDPDIRADCVVLPTGAWLDLQNTHRGRICVHGNPNVLTIDKGTSGLAQGNIAHTAVVQVEKWDAPLPPLRAHRQPPFDVKSKEP